MAYIGVDVGTGSVRCAAFDKDGKILTSPVVKDISQTCPKPGYYQQNSEEIWNTVCENTKIVLTDLKSRSIEVKARFLINFKTLFMLYFSYKQTKFYLQPIDKIRTFNQRRIN